VGVAHSTGCGVQGCSLLAAGSAASRLVTVEARLRAQRKSRQRRLSAATAHSRACPYMRLPPPLPPASWHRPMSCSTWQT
jgi:hypothetical protein